MADDLDVHELLEAPYQKMESESKNSKDSSNNGRGRSDRERDRKSHRSRSRDKDRHRRSRSRDRDRERHRRRQSRSRSRDRHRRRSHSRDRSFRVEMTPEERDARTVFCMQLSQRVRRRDIEEFFSSVGKVTDVRMIMCNKTRRFKGIVYVEFREIESVTLALALSGQRLLGVPILVQPSQAEKNRAASSSIPANKIHQGVSGSMRLYVGSLHYNITEDMVRSIFEPFGKIDDIQLIMDSQTGRSKGYGFLTYRQAEDAKRALDKLNGFELAGRPMKVGLGTERSDVSATGSGLLDSDDMDRSGIDLGATGRLQLMAKLAEGTGMQLPMAAASALGHPAAAATQLLPTPQQQVVPAPPITTQCFMLSNMFSPDNQSASLESEICDDVIDECNKHGGVVHLYVDKQSPQGNVYVKCTSLVAAAASVTALHGRWFAGKVITAAYVPLMNYHSLFPDSVNASVALKSSRSQRSLV